MQHLADPTRRRPPHPQLRQGLQPAEPQADAAVLPRFSGGSALR